MLVIDTSVIISRFIADSKTRERIVTLERALLTPPFVNDDLENFEPLIGGKSGMESDRVLQFGDLPFQSIGVVPAEEFYPAMERADAAIGDTDPDALRYLVGALATDAAVRSEEADFDEQELVETYSTSDLIDSFHTFQRTV